MRLWFASILGSSFLSSLSDLLLGQPQGMAVAQEVSSSMGEDSSAPYFLKTFGGFADDAGQYIQVTKDGGTALTGYTTSFGSGGKDVLVAQLDRNGQVAWATAFGGPDDDGGAQIHQLEDGSFVLLGYANNLGVGASDFLIAQLNQRGSINWARVLGRDNQDYAWSFQVMPNGGFVLAGQSWINNKNRYYDAAVVRMDSAGGVLWAKHWGGREYDMAHAIEVTQGSDVVLAGKTRSYGAGGYDAFVTKLSGVDGKFLWATVLGGSEGEVVRSMVKTKEGGFVLAGYTASFGVGGKDMLLFKLDARGRLVWAKALGGPGDEMASSIEKTRDGGFVVMMGSTSDSGTGGYDEWVTRWTAEGDLAWAWALESSADTSVGSAQEMTGGGFILTGNSKSLGSGGGTDVLVAKLNATGGIGYCPSIQAVSPTLTDLTSVMPVDSVSADSIGMPSPFVNVRVSLREYNATAFLRNNSVCFHKRMEGFNFGGMVTQAFRSLMMVGVVAALLALVVAICRRLIGGRFDYNPVPSKVDSKPKGLGQFGVPSNRLRRPNDPDRNEMPAGVVRGGDQSGASTDWLLPGNIGKPRHDLDKNKMPAGFTESSRLLASEATPL